MSWTAPSGHVFATGEIVTAATLNTYVKDNLIDLDRRTAPVQAGVATEQGTTSTTFTDLATVGPAVTVTVGSTGKALLAEYAYMYSTTSGGTGLVGYAVSGATIVPAGDLGALSWAAPTALAGVRHGASLVLTGLNAGSTTFTLKYRSASASNTAYAGDRILSVSPLGS